MLHEYTNIFEVIMILENRHLQQWNNKQLMFKM